MSARPFVTPVALLLPLVWALFSGCGSTTHEEQLAELSHGCLVNSDCAAPLICAFQRCHVECETTRDCDGSLRCVGAHEASRVCQLEQESTCETSADCAVGFVCSSDGACRDSCEYDAECVGEQVCTAGVCAEPSELDDTGKLPQTLERSTCRLNSDCAQGLQCVNGACVAQCRDDRDCAADSVCEDGACRSRGVDCSGDDCACACHADVDCAAGQRCDGCACGPAPDPECTSSLQCEGGGRCIGGACACACKTDRDCGAGLRCDGCSCQGVSAGRTIHDATLRDASDILLMRGITEVEGLLTLDGMELTTTVGLESLETIGALTIQSTSNLQTPEGGSALAGLSGLRLIRGDVYISNAGLADVDFPAELRIEGNVFVQATSVSCEEFGAFEQRLKARGFAAPQTFTAQFNLDCNAQCVEGACDQH